MKNLQKFTILFFSLVLLTACNSGTATALPTDVLPNNTADIEPKATSASDDHSLINKLRIAGASVDSAGEIEQPFFSVTGQVIIVNGGDVQIFEYRDGSTANAEAALVSPDGSSIGTSMVSWIGTPHFYQADKIIVLYVGDSPAVLEVLETVLGPQFAGGLGLPSLSPGEGPPPATLEINGQEQTSGIGTYCWESGGLGLCADMVGIPTAQEPMLVGSPFSARFSLAIPGSPETLSLLVIPVAPEDQVLSDARDWRWWPHQAWSNHELPLEQQPEIELSLEPGLYVLSLFASWQELGDVTYGFLLKVQ